MSDERAGPPGNGRVRLFVALELPEAVRKALVRWRGGVATEVGRSLREVSPDALHVTLCFLGWRAENEIEPIASACTIVGAEPAPALSLGSPLWLPRRRPRVLAVELVDPPAQLAHIQSALSSALAAGGWYEPENRPYLAHVTVARVKGNVRVGQSELPEPPRLDFDARRVVLYRSRLSRSGARYEPLATVELAGA